MKVLLVTCIAPVPTYSGGNQRTNLLYQALRGCGDVDLVLLADPRRYTKNEMTAMLQDYGLRSCLLLPRPHDHLPWRLLPLPLRLRKRLSHGLNGNRWLLQVQPLLRTALRRAIDFGSYDLIVGRYAASLAVLGLHRDRPAPLALDVDDWDIDRFQSRIDHGVGRLERFVLQRYVRNLRRAIPPVVEPVGTLWVSNSDNLREPLLRDAQVLPNIPFRPNGVVEAPLPFPAESEVITTVGSYSHRPNVAGVDWFLKHVWPEVAARRPGAIFRIHGSALDASLRERWSRQANVHVVGYVEHVEHAYADASLSVCAVPSGAGSNIKVLESLAFGRACVATPSGARGFNDLKKAGAIVVSPTPAAMARDLVHFLAHPAEARQRGECGRELVARHYSFDTFARIVRAGVTAATRTALVPDRTA